MRSVKALWELSSEQAHPVGTRVHVAEDGVSYTSVGQTTQEIAERLGWTQQNVWVPDHVEQRLHQRHPEIERPMEAMAHILAHPISVRSDVGKLGEPVVRFVIDAGALRAEGFVQSQTIKWVDIKVELRSVDRAVVLRVYHMAPTRQRLRGAPLWP